MLALHPGTMLLACDEWCWHSWWKQEALLLLLPLLLLLLVSRWAAEVDWRTWKESNRLRDWIWVAAEAEPC